MDYRALLNQHDDPVHWEWPPHFDYEAAEREFHALVASLETRLAMKLVSESGSHIQDASFRGQVAIPQGDEQAMLRCSNFGRMAAIANQEILPEPAKLSVLSVLAEHGYVFVPEVELSQPYTGKNPGVTGIDTWWVRYFDWV